MLINKSDYLIKRIKSHQRTFLSMARKVVFAKSLEKKCNLAQKAADFAVSHVTDIYSSDIIEAPFLELAQTIHLPLAAPYKPQTILHVMTEAYVTGGHTRCVERWAQNMSEYKHSCVVLNQQAELPEQLFKIMQASGGEFFRYPVAQPMIEKAKELRQLASAYQYVVLHIHMNDPTALIAFGTKEFQRPIIFFNHADHIFWLGVSIADCVADLTKFGHNITCQQRGAVKSEILGIPCDSSEILTIDKKSGREKLGIPLNQKIIFSSGSENKFIPLKRPDFSDIITDIIHENKDVVFYIAGVKENKIFWPKLLKKFPNNLIIKGYLHYLQEFPYYLAAADLVIDSYPVGGGTALNDAIRAGKPVITLNKGSDSYKIAAGVNSYAEFLDRVNRILNDPKFCRTYQENIYSLFMQRANKQNWNARCRDILENLPSHHKIYDFHSPKPTAVVSDCSLKNAKWVEPDIFCPHKLLFKKILKFILQIHFSKKKKLVKVLGFPILNWKKN